MTANDRPTTISAAQLAGEWETWQERIAAGECHIDANLAGRYWVIDVIPFHNSFLLKLDDGQLKDVPNSHDLIVKWLTPAPEATLEAMAADPDIQQENETIRSKWRPR